MSQSVFDIAIVGAGVTGLTLAALLTQSHHADRLRIRVIDAAPRPQFDTNDDLALRVSAVANGSAAILHSVGAWHGVEAARCSPYEAMRVWDENTTPEGRTTLSFDASEFAVPQLGFIVENVLLQDALLRVLDDSNVELQFLTKITELPQADLLVGADGARSVIRELAGIETQQWPYEQTAVVTMLAPEKSHQSTAWQRFLREGPVGLLPLADGRVSVVWSTTTAIAAEAMAANDEQLSKILSDASDHVLGKLRVAGDKGAFALQAQHAKNYVLPGLALIGDAAHAIHPLAGQGANLGLQDAAALAEVIVTAFDNGQSPSDRPVLRRYERQRKGANLTMLHFMTGLNRLFTTDSSLVGEIRTLGMRMFNSSGPIRERAVKVALGIK